MSVIRLLLNIIWLVFAGFWLAVGYVIAGLICCLLIVTIPFGVASFRIAGYVLWPFGREMIRKPGAGVGAGFLNVIWFVVAGWWLALGHLFTAAALAVTIIGIPMAWANIKLIPISLVPFGREVVDSDRLVFAPRVPAGQH
ncbi:YccF domain-containing protein [Cryptosporangium phraense]|uniref:YccF domain-containing protein n=1 Tax=Cryptosporangium phraense TaxID=2593070 RepID=A0A545AG76_9ACTN|nr:YccF domain-containing protein [Cryptosporangium phraense]TQS40324.1 YccF domain-containing protein [Cryptosporangium phraense]